MPTHYYMVILYRKADKTRWQVSPVLQSYNCYELLCSWKGQQSHLFQMMRYQYKKWIVWNRRGANDGSDYKGNPKKLEIFCQIVWKNIWKNQPKPFKCCHWEIITSQIFSFGTGITVLWRPYCRQVCVLGLSLMIKAAISSKYGIIVWGCLLCK